MTDRKDAFIMRGYINKKEAAPITNLESVKKYQTTRDAFKLRPSLEEGRKIREYAARTGRSVQGLFLEALREYMEKHSEEK